jgi:metallo-beta-lactamase family protein
MGAPTTLTFLGAARTVTGSKYLLTVGERRILVDAGLFQGEKALRLRNWEDFPVPPDSITDVIVTHAHLDHSGYLPALVRQGFSGPIWSTAGTRDLAAIVLRDAGFLAERDAQEAAQGGWSKHNPPLPIYTSEDVERTLPLFVAVPFDEDVDLEDGVTAHFTRAGHILGSASVTVRTPTTSVLFSGDLGRHDHPILRPHGTPAGTACVVVESTYGDREHPEPVNLSHEALADAVRRTVARGGSVLIPAFAVDRTEIVLRTLSEMRQNGRIPDVPIIVNSPMASSALEIYRRSHDELRPDLDAEDFAKIPNLVEVRSAEDSMALTRGRRRDPSIIISASGMATGGRVLHHLERMLPDPRDCIVLSGYQAVGTRGRALLEGAKQLKLHGAYVPVKAEIVNDAEFSVHADASDLIDWLRDLQPAPTTVFVTHGEEVPAESFAERVRTELGLSAVVPDYGEKVVLGEPAYAVPGTSPDGAGAGAEVSAAARELGGSAPAAAAAERREPAASVGGLGAQAAGQVVASDLRVKSRSGNEVVLEGTITVRLPD